VIALILVFDARFQLIGLAGAALALVLFGQVRVLLVLALAVPFALFGFGFLKTSLLFREEGGYALQVAGEAAISGEALQAGIVLFLRALSCGMVSALFVLTTDPGALVKAAMRDWRLPPRVGYALFSVPARRPRPRVRTASDQTCAGHEERRAPAPDAKAGRSSKPVRPAPRLRHPPRNPRLDSHGGARPGGGCQADDPRGAPPRLPRPHLSRGWRRDPLGGAVVDHRVARPNERRRRREL
jgi:hypothetical protein